jgi:hypothetical protein
VHLRGQIGRVGRQVVRGDISDIGLRRRGLALELNAGIQNDRQRCPALGHAAAVLSQRRSSKGLSGPGDNPDWTQSLACVGGFVFGELYDWAGR